MLLLNIDHIPGKEYEVLAMVQGSTVQSKNIAKDLMQNLKTIVGGELVGYTEMMNDARATATNRMIEMAESLGADAIINIRYTSSAVMQSAADILAYGTAVKFK